MDCRTLGHGAHLNGAFFAWCNAVALVRLSNSSQERRGMAVRIVYASNRLPIVLERSGGEWSYHPASGGLVTALVPLLKKWGGAWVGWPGIADQDAAELGALTDRF